MIHWIILHIIRSKIRPLPMLSMELNPIYQISIMIFLILMMILLIADHISAHQAMEISQTVVSRPIWSIRLSRQECGWLRSISERPDIPDHRRGPLGWILGMKQLQQHWGNQALKFRQADIVQHRWIIYWMPMLIQHYHSRPILDHLQMALMHVRHGLTP